MDEKLGLPSYEVAAATTPNTREPRRSRRSFRRSRAIRFFVLACLGLLVLAQWKQLSRSNATAPKLSIEKLNKDKETCKKLRAKPSDPLGAGREKNARYIEGGKPTLIKNATVWTGEPVKGTSEADARAGNGWDWINVDVLLEHGLIKKVEAGISLSSLPEDTIVYDAEGRQLTAGIIDMHSHGGVDSLPELEGNEDSNEMSDNITPWARSIDGIYPLDKQLQTIKSGGVTTSLILPGSGNNIGGEAFLVKHAVGKPDGRVEISAKDMLADPDRNWRFMKMACGENPKRVYGQVGRAPFSRMGESYQFRHAFEQARSMIQKQDDWCEKADTIGVENMEEYLPQEILWETLGAALRGQVHVNVHCYTVPDLEAMVDHTNEFEFAVRAFHHAHQTYLVPEILNRTWGGRPPASALFADNMYYKAEAYVATEFAGKILYDAGLTPVYVSDNPVLNAQHVLFEAAKAYSYGLPYHAALAGVTTAPAEELGMGQRLGKVKAGFDADIAVWDSDPLSVGATPVQVWIDGAAQFEEPFLLDKPREGPLVPDASLANIVEEPTEFRDAIFTGVTKVLLSDDLTYESDEGLSVVVSEGDIVCIGTCKYEMEVASKSSMKKVDLKNGYITRSFTGVAGTIGINEIDSEVVADNGDNPVVFSRAVDGLLLDSKKLHAASYYGVTRGISAPKFAGGNTHHGTSVGFVTTARTSLEEDAIFASDVAVHYTLDLNIRGGTSYSAAFGGLRQKLIVAATGTGPITDPFSEAAYLKKVMTGEKVLALTIHSVEGIATALRIKSDIESLLITESTAPKIKLAIIGGAEAHLAAKELAEASVGVILSPLQATGARWDQRRVLTGAPLTNGTAVDILLEAGVVTAVGLEEDWQVRDLGFAAGIAFKNSNGRISEQQALDLVSVNVHKILGAELPEAQTKSHFIVSEGNPLEIGGRVKAVGSGRGRVAIFM